MISPSEYIKAKAKGLLTSKKLEAEYALDVKSFSQADGSELNPTRHNIRPGQLQDARALLLAELANLDIMIADLEALS